MLRSILALAGSALIFVAGSAIDSRPVQAGELTKGYPSGRRVAPRHAAPQRDAAERLRRQMRIRQAAAQVHGAVDSLNAWEHRCTRFLHEYYAWRDKASPEEIRNGIRRWRRTAVLFQRQYRRLHAGLQTALAAYSQVASRGQAQTMWRWVEQLHSHRWQVMQFQYLQEPVRAARKR